MAMAVLLALVAPATTGAIAQGEPRLEDGVWMSSFHIAGSLSGTRGGMPANLTGAFDGGGIVAVDDGLVGGSWTFTGGTYVVVGNGAMTWDLGHTAFGSFDGGADTIVMEGTDVPNGTLTTPNGSRPSSEPGPVGPLDIEIEQATCTFASAEFAMPMEGLAEEEGWSQTNLDGHFTAFRARPELADGLDAAADPQAAADSLPQAVTDAIELHAEVAVIRGEAVDGSLDFDHLADLLAEAERIQAELADPTGCARQLLEGQVHAFMSMLTDAVASLITIALDEMSLDAAQLHRLASAGVRTGALGAGSLQPGRASALDVRLRLEAETILLDHLVLDGERVDGQPCPCVDLDASSLTNLTILAVTMQWHELPVGSETVPAHELVNVRPQGDA